MTTSNETGIDIIGLGVSARAQLSEQALTALKHADIVFGSERQLATVKHLLSEQKTQYLPKLSQLQSSLKDYDTQSVVVLASGDPLFYGIGRWFSRHYGTRDSAAKKLRFHPAVSSLQAACHYLGLSLQDTEVVSLHGRPLQNIRSVLKQNQNYIVLTDQHSQPKHLAQECQLSGFENSTFWVCENLGYPQQQVRQFNVEQLLKNEFNFEALHVTVIFSRGSGGIRPEFPGIADEDFITDTDKRGKGLLTKREVRLAILSLLQPQAEDIAWDIGAGCGGVSIEWALWNKKGQVYAIEHHEKRLVCLQANQERFGVQQNLIITKGRAPETLTTLADPSVVFIGGSDGALTDILSVCWERLKPGGRLVASAITENSKQCLQQFSASHPNSDVQTTQISISRGEQLAGQLVYRPALPVTLFKLTKNYQLSSNVYE